MKVRRFPALVVLALGLQGRPSPAQPFSIFSRHRTSAPLLEAWREEGGLFVLPSGGGLHRPSSQDRRKVTPASLGKAPAPPPPRQGTAVTEVSIKYRLGCWWALHRVTDLLRPRTLEAVEVHRWDPTARSWVLSARTPGVIATTFEPLDEGRVVLMGCKDLKTHQIFLSGLADPASIDLREPIPYPKAGDQLPQALAEELWSTCLTTSDPTMVYAYFPGAGRLFGLDRTTLAIRDFREPWPRLDADRIREQLSRPHPQLVGWCG